MSETPKNDNNGLPDSKDGLLQEAVLASDEQQASKIVESMSSQEVLREASQMKADDRDQLITILPPETAAELVEEAPVGLAVSIIEGLDSSVAAKIMDELQSDTQADIVQEMEEEDAEAVLSEMDAEAAVDVRQLSQFDPDTAGGLMELEVFSFTEDQTVGAVLKRLVEGDDEHEHYRRQYPYIVDATGKLIGIVPLRSLLGSKRSVRLSEIMRPPISVKPAMGQDELVKLFDEKEFLSMPVVDEQGILLGIVSRIELAEAELERAEQQSLSRQKVGDELRSMPTLLRSRRRLAWLSSNIVLNIIAASVISMYEETLAAVIAIAIFLPMVSDMSGCSGMRFQLVDATSNL